MGSVYVLTLRQLSGRWRLVIMSVLASMPVLMAAMLVRSDRAPSVEEFELVVLSGMLAGAVLPLVVLAVASTAFANEVEDPTLANITLSPIPLWHIVVPKLLAAVSVSGPFVALSAFLTSYVAYNADLTATFAVTVSALAGVALYSSAFVWLGLVTTKAIGIGLFYIIRILSVRYHSIALMHGLDGRRFAEENTLSVGFAVGASIVVFAGFLLLSIRRLRRMDVP
jgi:ABC-type transport system involved in multi-copper enzyme maturation permease subunit